MKNSNPEFSNLLQVFAGLIFLGILHYPAITFAQYSTLFTEDEIVIDTVFSLESEGTFVESIVPHDLNSDGYEDLLIITNETAELSASLYVLPGSESGFNQEEAITLIDQGFIRNLQVGDWNGDLEMDLIVEKFTSGDRSYTEVYIMEGMEVQDTVNFSVMDEGYDFKNVVTIIGVEDLDLDGRAEVIYGAYQNLIVAWNNGDKVEFEAITTDANNSYRAHLLDINQDGFMDLIADEQTAKAPVVYVNQKDRTFERQLVGLPESGPGPEEGNYHLQRPILFNDDMYPDLLVNREVKAQIDTMGMPVVVHQYEIYEYDEVEQVYEISEFSIDSLLAYNSFHPVHLNNDGYLDFLQKNEENFTFVRNIDSKEFSIQEVEVPSDISIWDITNVDADQDGDQDVLYSQFHEAKVYQVTNNDTSQSHIPTFPEIRDVEADQNTIHISWEEGFNPNNSPNAEYGIKVISKDRSLRLGNVNPVNGSRQTSKVLSGFQNNTLSIPNLPNGTYNVEVTTYNQVGKFSGFTTGETVTINTTSNEEQPDRIKNFELFQNYPNPFNPTTNIKYQLPNTSYVTLEVFDLAGRLVSTLVEELQPSGIYEVTFNGENISSGLYIYRMQAGEQVFTRKLVLVK